MIKNRQIYQQFSWIGVCFISTMLIACSFTGEKPTLVTSIAPGPLPDFLLYVYPRQGAFLSLDDYTTAQNWGSRFENCINPSPVCIRVDACNLLCEGDFWEFDDVYTRTTILVDNQLTGGQVGDVYGLLMGCYIEDSQGNLLARVGGPYEWCVYAPLVAGVHRVDMSFERSNGEIASFAWTFELVSGPVPTPTSLPVPLEVDQVGHLPDYIKAVYPWPGEEVCVSPSREEWQEVLDSMGMPDSVQPTSPNKLPVCFALAYPEVLELGTLPAYNSFLDRIYFSIDGIALEESLYRSPYNNSLGVKTSPQCFEIPLIPGKHIATVYVDTFDADLVAYSWAFTIEGR